MRTKSIPRKSFQRFHYTFGATNRTRANRPAAYALLGAGATKKYYRRAPSRLNNLLMKSTLNRNYLRAYRKPAAQVRHYRRMNRARNMMSRHRWERSNRFYHLDGRMAFFN